MSRNIALFLTAIFACCIGAAAADFHVSPRGSDDATGGEADPFATMERARESIRGMKQGGMFPESGVTVWLRGGDYLRTSAFELVAEDSGSADAPIVWEAYPGEKVRLLGGTCDHWIQSGHRPGRIG